MEKIELIKALSDAFGPSGFEDDVVAIIKDELAELNPVEDTLRNVRVKLTTDETLPTVMLDAHTDEVGLIVQAVKPNGTMKFLTLGGWTISSMPANTYNIRNRDGKLVKAVVAQKPVHFLADRSKPDALTLDSLVLDPGTSSKEETENIFRLKMACPAVPDVKCEYNEVTKVFSGKAFDDRIGVAATIETIRRLQGKALSVNVAGSFSAQEEVGDRGVLANVTALKPQIAICFEGCPADDTFMEPYLIQTGLHKGPMLRHVDVSMITNPRFQKFALDLAEKYNIPVQEAVRSGGGTNGAVTHIRDIPTIVIGIPTRYAHSNNCYCALDDFDNAVELAVKIVEELNKETIASF